MYVFVFNINIDKVYRNIVFMYIGIYGILKIQEG